MKPTRRLLPRLLRLLALTAALGSSMAWADDYADLTQLLKAGKPDQALAKADERLAANAKDPQLRFLRGVAQAESGKRADAIATFTQLTQDYPELPEPYNNLAVLYASQNQLDQARTALEMAIRTNPSYATAHENLGDIYAKLASQAYAKALQLDTGSAATVKPKLSLIREMFASPAKTGAAAATTTPDAAPAPAAKPQASADGAASQAAGAAAQAAPEPVVAAAAPAAVQAPDTTASTDAAAREVEAAVRAWAAAWSAQDMAAYLAAYDKSFAPPGRKTRAQWAKEREARIVGKKDIQVKVSQLAVSVDGDKAQARFHQTYRSNALDSNTRKTLDLVRRDGHWAIVREAVGG